ncbi:MAG: sulfatase [Candidatus Azobacteroides sp.]|nr:sulfatase [Candidatus Azobacteroides sp.]
MTQKELKKMKQTLLSCVLLPGVLSAAEKKSAPAQEKQERPNIIFIMSDDHSYQTVGCYGYGLVQTPNLDRLARTGTFFRNNFCANSLSGPARAVILTGKFSHMNGYKDNESGAVFDQSQQTFPKLLQRAGYQTAIIGKWHLKNTPLGFDYFSILDGQGHYYNPDFIESDGVHKSHGYVTDLTMDKTLDWLQNKRDKKQPFYLSCHFKAPHRNWMAALDKLEMYEETSFPLPSNFYDDYDGRIAARLQLMEIGRDSYLGSDYKMWGLQTKHDLPDLVEEYARMTPEEHAKFSSFYAKIEEDLKKQNLKGHALWEWKYQRFMRDYCKVISSVDDNVGRLIDYLQHNGLWENTIVIYTSDQGFMMGEHGWFDKRWIYEQTFRAPFIISYPAGLSPSLPKEMSAMIQSIDYAPTFLDYAGVEIPSDIQGVSLRPLLEGRTDRAHDAVYYHFYEYPAFHAVKRHYGCRTDRYKIAHFYYDIDEWELYDLQNDPMEMHNLYDNPAFSDVQNMMLDKLKELQIRYNEPDPTKDNYTPLPPPLQKNTW